MIPTTIIELVLKIVLVAMEGQPPEVRAKLWERHMEWLEKSDAFWERLGKFFLDRPTVEAVQDERYQR